MRVHEVAYIEINPRVDRTNPSRVTVELTDCSVFYSQGVAEAITAELNAGKSEVLCDAGKPIKVSKDK